jgi:hypothetical protein
MSVREWALREGRAGKRIDRDEAKGILIAALGVKQRDTHLLLRNATFRRPFFLLDAFIPLAYTACMSPAGAAPCPAPARES